MAKKYLLEDIEGFPAILYQESTPDGFTDVSPNAVLIDKYGTKVRDYLFVRNDINNILFIKANPNYPTVDFSGFFTNMTAEERKIMAKHILAPYQLRLTQYSDADDEYNWFQLLDITQGTIPVGKLTGRSLLIERMRKHVANKVRIEALTMASTQTFFKDIKDMKDWYIFAAAPDFKLWLNNLAPYDTTGFSSKSYWTQTLQDELVTIYEGLD